MHRFTHWLFALSPLPRLFAVIVVFVLLGGGLFFSLSTRARPTVNLITQVACSDKPASVDPSGQCENTGTYKDFRYICGSGQEGYLGTEESNCLSLEQATVLINKSCQSTCEPN